MKNIVLIFGMLFAVTTVWTQSLQFNNKEHCFPTLRENDKESVHLFHFVNKSSSAVYLTGVVCPQKNIRITWDKDTIGKKENGAISVTLNPKNNVGKLDCTIQISTLENGKVMEYTLKVTGEILEREKSKQEIYNMKEGNLRYKNNYKRDYKLTPTSVFTDTFFFYNEWEETMTFSCRNLPAPIEIVYLTPRLAPLEEGILVFRYNAELKKDWGFIHDQFTVNTNDPERPGKALSIAGELYDDFASWTPQQKANPPKIKFSEEEYPFGTETEGKNVEHTFTITNVGQSVLHIRKVKGSCSCTAGQPEKNELNPGESTTMKMTFRTRNKTGRQMPTIDLISNDPERPKVTLKMTGNVVKPLPTE